MKTVVVMATANSARVPPSSMKSYNRHKPTGRFVPGEGPRPCAVVLVGEGPGTEEDRLGRPFIGPSGRMLEMLLRLAGLERDECYITNLTKRWTDEKHLTAKFIQSFHRDLDRELAECDPELVVTLGAYSARHFLGDVYLEVCHGIPQFSETRVGYGTKKIVVFPAYHPAAGLHSTELQGALAWDFQQLRLLLKGQLEIGMPVDQIRLPFYSKSEPTSLRGTVAIDTEGSAKKPWGLTCSEMKGTAHKYSTARVKKDARVILHNSMHDLSVLRALGIELGDGQFDDTMVKAYLLGVEPQGLKALAKRYCGMEMQSYEEVLGTAQQIKSMEWLWDATEWLSKHSNAALLESSRTELKRIRKSAGLASSKTSRKTAGKRK